MALGFFSRKDRQDPASEIEALQKRISELEGQLRNSRAANRRLSVSVSAWQVVGEELVKNRIITKDGLRSFISQARRYVAEKKKNGS